MLFNYHVKEKFRQCAFSSKKTKQNGKKEKKAVGAQCEDPTALTELGTVTYCTLYKTDSPLETEEAVEKEPRNMQASGLALMSKALPFTLRTGKKNQAQETCPENKQDC